MIKLTTYQTDIKSEIHKTVVVKIASDETFEYNYINNKPNYDITFETWVKILNDDSKFILNIIQTFKKPRLRVWRKDDRLEGAVEFAIPTKPVEVLTTHKAYSEKKDF